LGASPVWTLLWEERPAWSMRSAQRYGAAGIALLGVVVLFWPAFSSGGASWRGECLGVTASVMWANYGRQCRRLSGELSGAELSAHTMWRAGLLLLPVALLEVEARKPVWRPDLVGAQAYCVVAGGVVAYALWNNALRHWPTSRVFLFNNLIPLSTMSWARACLGEPVTRTFWSAMILVVAGVVLGQARGQWFLGPRRVALE
jgi:drug/metabolite transporter (DMT)-like permease